jgi:hypothetical protein
MLDVAGHGEFDDLKRAAGLVAGFLQPAAIVGEDFVVVVFGVGLDGGDDRALGDETGQVVHVAVGVVADDAFAEPDDVLLAIVIL